MCRYLKYFLILTLCANRVFAQLLPFKHYRSKDGLISDKVTAVIRDQKGLLWVGTEFGINWYDGNHFVKPAVDIRSGQLYVTDFYKDKQNNIWMMSFYNGIYKYQDGKFKNYLPDSNRIESNANSSFAMLQYDDNRFLVATDENVFWFDGKKFSKFDPTNTVIATQTNAIAMVKDQWLFFGHPHGVFVYRFENGKWVFAGQKFKELDVSKILTTNGGLWMSTNKGLYFFDEAKQLAEENPTRLFFKNQFVSNVSENKNTGELWVPVDKLYRIKDDVVLSYDVSNGLATVPWKTYIDDEEIVWMTSVQGLTKFARQYYVFYDLRRGPSNAMINAMAYDNYHNLWLGSYDGIAVKNENGLKDFRKVGEKKIGYVSWILNTKNYGLLASTEAGILLLQENKIQILSDAKSTKAFEDEQGILWMGTVEGRIYKLVEGKMLEVQVTPGLGDFIDAIYKDKSGKLWIGYRTNGIRKYAINGNECKPVKEFSTKTGYKDLRIRCCFADKNGNLIFGTRTNGLFIISKDGEQVWQVGNSQGLSANWVRNINQDEQGTLYLATNQGLNLLTADYSKPLIRKVNLLNDELREQTTSIVMDRNRVVVGTEEGLVEYFPQIDKMKPSTPPVFITEVSINGKPDSSMPAYFSFAEKKFQTGNNFIAIEFSGINLHDDATLQYRYKLEGQDKDWIYAGERNYVSYHLTPGNYQFKAEARNSFGQWSNQPASFKFIIPAPFWRTWWFIAGVSISIAILLFLIYRYRVQQTLKLERLRHRISTDLHDDIGSTLSSISILSEIASKEKDLQQSGSMMQEIKHSSVSLMEKMDDIVWSINPRNDSIENLMLRIKRFASKLLEAKEIDYTINIDSSIQKAKLQMEARQHIYLIMKEAINNQVKYSNCSRSFIGVKYEQNCLKIEISDNGRGFNPNIFHEGNGILSMKKRAEAIRGEIKLITEPGKGTTILLEAKIK